MTRILGELRAGQSGAESALFEAVYGELRRIAGACMRGEYKEHTLQPTALVHEAYLRLLGNDAPEFADKRHFLSAAARAMRHILVDHGRARRALKRGGAGIRVTLNDELHGDTDSVDRVLAVHDALAKLEADDPIKGRLVELRYFGGLQFSEIAEVMELSPRSIYRLWDRARAWLFAETSA